MDAYEATRIVMSRVQTLDPDNATKIMGLLLLQDHGEKEMIRLAFGPEALLHSVVVKARKDLGLLPPTTTTTPSSPSSFLLSRQNSSSRLPSPSSWAPPPVFSRSDSVNGVDDFDDFQLSFLNDPAAAAFSPSSLHALPVGPRAGGGDLFYSDLASECRSPSSNGGVNPYEGMGWETNGHHRRSCSMADLCLGSEAAGLGWRPCLYFARGYCKNGNSCRFLHGFSDEAAAAAATMEDSVMEQQCQELLRSKSQRASALMASAASFPYSTSVPSPTSSKCNMNYHLQQQSENQRMAAALMMGGGGEEQYKFAGRYKMDRNDFSGMVSPVSRQIYLTFPADSTFREEDVSNYFSIYGPVQDVRIPYQQKRMFGFVTFVYPETVKLILAKGNPHFVCDARVLVKPYKEKGKVPDKYRKLQQQQQQVFDRGDLFFSTPTGMDSPRELFDLQQLGARMLLHNSHELLLRRKLQEEQQQQQADLQKAIELQGRRFMGLQLLDLKTRNLYSPPVITPITAITASSSSQEEAPVEDKCLSPAISGSATTALSQAEEAAVTVTAAGPEQCNTHALLQKEAAVRSTPTSATASADEESTPHARNVSCEDCHFQESVEHNLPDSPFASTIKPSSFTGDTFSMVSEQMDMANSPTLHNHHHHLMATSTLDRPSFNSCFFQMPRFSSGHGAVGM